MIILLFSLQNDKCELNAKAIMCSLLYPIDAFTTEKLHDKL